ncbi:outer membrane protein assembly factor BamE [Nitrogeniibacter mangrovi]|uniref:Outer membrane protein assembly factor BamE n=1 Tax=Nitrogeniibacter mangrovi TaxID=2016596 RepID=A0A6C1B781_9RHOO|nr:outer membrane protein assembly factor BamE [Nitrogeniibacter mangrovi]QID18160.1 outer membrane protein assembly factor BamE [Nitrogeniibacter mangrovi]
MPDFLARALIAAAVLLTVAGCGVTEKLRPYRLDIRQGNFVTQDMISQLKKGMSREQVRFALGTPLLTDVFHADRWDYVYRFKPGYGETEQRIVTLYFENDKLARVAGDVTAANPDATAEAPKSRIRELDLSASAASPDGADADKPAKTEQ